MSSPEPDYVATNRAVWTRSNARYTDAKALEAWRAPHITWGVWGVAESELRALPDDLAGLDVVELGCGTAYFSAWLARRGARPVGVDPTPAQLETARRCQRELGLEFPLVEAYAESVPLPDEAFDLALSEYGASIWADPYRWIPEAARLLRAGGVLVFLRNSTVSMLCAPDVGHVEERLLRPQRGMYRIDWPDADEGVEFHLPPGDLLRLLRANGFEILDLIEIFAPAEAVTHEFYDYVPAEWAKQWPSEEIWVARKARV
jgi:SAM-dependent methyltransferase